MTAKKIARLLIGLILSPVVIPAVTIVSLFAWIDTEKLTFREAWLENWRDFTNTMNPS